MTRAEGNFVVLTTKVPASMRATFRQQARREEKTPSWLMREILAAYLKRKGFTVQ